MSVLAAPLRQAGANALRAGRLQEAITTLLKSAEADPQSFETWSFLGAAYSRVNDYTQARQAFGRAIQIDVHSVRGWHNLGVAHQMGGDDESAATCFRRAVELDPSYAPAVQALAILTPKPMTMSELASVGGTVRLPGAQREAIEDQEPIAPHHTLTPQELAQLATPEGSFHMTGAQATEIADEDPREPKPG